MCEEKKKESLNTMEYYEWVAQQKFENSKEHHQYVSYQEQDFLQKVIYPMFYHYNTPFKTTIPFPLVLREHSSRKPKYIIDTNFFTIVFFSYDNWDDEMCWEVSVHIKDHDFCDKRINEFKSWYSKYYERLFAEMKTMPEEFLYPKLNLYNMKVEDFCIEFWNNGRDFMLFKLFDLLRLF